VLVVVLPVVGLIAIAAVVAFRRRSTLRAEVDDFSRARTALGQVVRKSHDEHDEGGDVGDV
jgi:hypothetical protein